MENINEKIINEVTLAFEDVKNVFSKLSNNKKLLRVNIKYIGIISSLLNNLNIYYTENSEELMECDMDKIFGMIAELEIMKYKLMKKV